MMKHIPALFVLVALSGATNISFKHTKHRNESSAENPAHSKVWPSHHNKEMDAGSLDGSKRNDDPKLNHDLNHESKQQSKYGNAKQTSTHGYGSKQNHGSKHEHGANHRNFSGGTFNDTLKHELKQSKHG